jgi:hypothetical protein
LTGIAVTVTVSVEMPQLHSASSCSTDTCRRTVSPGASGTSPSTPPVITSSKITRGASVRVVSVSTTRTWSRNVSPVLVISKQNVTGCPVKLIVAAACPGHCPL